MKKIILISVLVILPIVSFAAIDIQKNKNGATLITSNNTYMAGGTVNILQGNPGDVYAAGGTILATGKVNADLVAAGGNISIVSQIAGDLRLAGGSININGPVSGELVALGGQVGINSASTINGDFIIAAGMININGSMNGNGKIFGNEVSISGVLNKNINVKAKKLVIENTAVVNGNINYEGNEETVIKEGAKVNGKITFTKIAVPQIAKRTGLTAIFTVFWFIKLLAALVAALVMFFLMRRNIQGIAKEALNGFWKELLRGFAISVLIPIAFILMFITLIGSALGVFGIALYFLLLILSVAFSGILVAELLNRLIFRNKSEKSLNWPMVILGVLVMQLLAFIPFVGWIARIAIFLVALGAISNLIFHKAKTLAE